MKTLNLNAILLVVLAIFGTILAMTLFRKSIPNEKVIRLEEQVKHKEEIRLKDSVYYSGLLSGKDSVIQVLISRNSEKQVQYVQLKTDYGKIRPTVESYSNHELLQRASEWRAE